MSIASAMLRTRPRRTRLEPERRGVLSMRRLRSSSSVICWLRSTLEASRCRACASRGLAFASLMSHLLQCWSDLQARSCAGREQASDRAKENRECYTSQHGRGCHMKLEGDFAECDQVPDACLEIVQWQCDETAENASNGRKDDGLHQKADKNASAREPQCSERCDFARALRDRSKHS